MNESRKLARGQTSDYFVVYNRADGNVLGRIRNLTNDGMMLISDELVEVPVVFNCKMSLPDIIEGYREIAFEMESRWCQFNKSMSWYETGFQFRDMPDVSRRVIDRLVQDWMTIAPVSQTDSTNIQS